MDAASLNNMFENIYIPSNKNKKVDATPVHHPSLVMLDMQTDTTHHLSCGCSGDHCISEQAWWIKPAVSGAAAAAPSSPRRDSEYSTISRSSSVSSFSSLSSY